MLRESFTLSISLYSSMTIVMTFLSLQLVFSVFPHYTLICHLFNPHRHDGEVEHYHVHKDQRDWFTVDDEKYFENLVKLIEHYKKPIALGLCCQLEYPVDKTGGNTKYAISTEDFIESESPMHGISFYV